MDLIVLLIRLSDFHHSISNNAQYWTQLVQWLAPICLHKDYNFKQKLQYSLRVKIFFELLVINKLRWFCLWLNRLLVHSFHLFHELSTKNIILKIKRNQLKSIIHSYIENRFIKNSFCSVIYILHLLVCNRSFLFVIKYLNKNDKLLYSVVQYKQILPFNNS